jgi:hypothetical protein
MVIDFDTGVCVAADMDAHLLRIGVGVLLAFERLDVARAVVIGIVDDPRLIISPLHVIHLRLQIDMIPSLQYWQYDVATIPLPFKGAGFPAAKTASARAAQEPAHTLAAAAAP